MSSHLKDFTEEEIESAKVRLEHEIKKKFSKPLNSVKSFAELSTLTNVSTQTLRRFFGKIDTKSKISTTTLSILSQYVGYQDWLNFVQNSGMENKLTKQDKMVIDNMAIFFKNGKKYNTDYFQNTQTVDTLNDYARIIYKNRYTVEYFYKQYKSNHWATDYILTYIPNYNFYGRSWFREILQHKAKNTKLTQVKLAQNNFLHFGAFLSKLDFDYDKSFKEIQTHYNSYRATSSYMPYHEMRYCTIQLLEYQKQGVDIDPTICNYIAELQQQNYPEANYYEILIFFCNTLFWLGKFQIAYELLKPVEKKIKDLNQMLKVNDAIHFFGINRAFVKITFSLIYLANNDKDIIIFELENQDFGDYADLLFHDYNQLLYLTKLLLIENGSVRKKRIFSELVEVVEKTNYSKIYDLLDLLDPDCATYKKQMVGKMD